jgi:hypothetical protein
LLIFIKFLIFQTLKERVKALSKLISVAQALWAMNNFHSMMGLVAGLNMSAVSRLKLTWEGLSHGFLKVTIGRGRRENEGMEGGEGKGWRGKGRLTFHDGSCCRIEHECCVKDQVQLGGPTSWDFETPSEEGKGKWKGEGEEKD